MKSRHTNSHHRSIWWQFIWDDIWRFLKRRVKCRLRRKQVGYAHVGGAGTQIDEIGVVYEQYMEPFSTKGNVSPSGEGGIFAEDKESRDLLQGISKPMRVSFEGNVGVGKSTILKLLQSHPRLQG